MQEDGSAQTSPETSDELQEIRSQVFISASTKLAVAKLLDSYLAEIAEDPNLPVLKFIKVVEMVSGSSRQVHDGLYRVIDTHLKGVEERLLSELSGSMKKRVVLARSIILTTERKQLSQSAADQFRKQFAHLEENGGKSIPVILLERKHVSLPRQRLVACMFLAIRNEKSIESFSTTTMSYFPPEARLSTE